jgi:hypothetical protein
MYGEEQGEKRKREILKREQSVFLYQFKEIACL